jgi:SEC-C motif-containing protein
MRSRYTAYATADIAHLQRSTHPAGPHWQPDPAAWAADLRAYCAAVRFDGLTVHDAHADGDTGAVRFFARLSADGRDLSFGEHSRFRREAGRWLYVDGDRWSG